MTVNACGGTKATFEKFACPSSGEPYQDAGQYNMRKPDRARSTLEKSKPWVQSGANKKVKKSEYTYSAQGPPARPVADPMPRFKTRVTCDPFTNSNNVGYSEDPYERRQDQERYEYALQNGRILHRD